MSYSHHDTHMLPSSSKKRKTPDSGLDEYGTSTSERLSSEEELLIQLTEKEDLPWKEVASRFNGVTGRQMKVPALQMRKKRLLERLRSWSDVEVLPTKYAPRWSPDARLTWHKGTSADFGLGGLRAPEVGCYRARNAPAWGY